jgi:hypothetical protein
MPKESLAESIRRSGTPPCKQKPCINLIIHCEIHNRQAEPPDFGRAKGFVAKEQRSKETR